MIEKTVSFGITDIRSIEVTCAKCGASIAISLRAEADHKTRRGLHEGRPKCVCGEPLWVNNDPAYDPVPQLIGALVGARAFAAGAPSDVVADREAAISRLRLTIRSSAD